MQRRTIDAELLSEVTRRLAESLKPEQIILFGSHARGTPSPDSDLDLFVIVTDSDLPPHQRAREAYRSLRGIGVPLDVVVSTRREVETKRQVPCSLAARVFDEGRILYG